MLFATMHIRNVTMAYDSMLGNLGYMCRAFDVGDRVGVEYGFLITVIRSKFLCKTTKRLSYGSFF